ncbi:fatty-acyl-CoA synthase [Marinobacter sp. es.048]|uniref:class I adenylate-forming enzyme family protein n=1 Tax=Marinobacter sp. es.048 TaxID=1761795 RepID=UPI000B598194|nr:AMP-binding protein [Marinobacter sp. es.048]SNC62603.1 fatty-acyl-CoA synthase [Marinobacter sp. es.048]
MTKKTTQLSRAEGIPLARLAEMRWIGDVPSVGAQMHPKRPALVFAERGTTLTYAELEQYSNAFAEELVSRGYREGDRVAYLGRNSDLYYPVLFGSIRAGVVLVPLNWRQSAGEIAYQLEDSGACWLLVDQELESLASEAVGQVAGTLPMMRIDGDDGDAEHLRARLRDNVSAPVRVAGHEAEQTVLQVYTSGTTGKAKGVLISHKSMSIARHAETISPDWANWIEGGISLSAMPNFHMGGMSWVMMGLVRLGTVIITADPQPSNMLRLMHEYGVEHSFIVPTVIRAIVDELKSSNSAVPGIKGIYYGAMPMSEMLLHEAMELFGSTCQFGHFFGMTELTGPATYLPPSEHDLKRPHLLKSVGRPIAGMSLEIRDPDGRVVPVGQPGEIWIKAPTLMQGYWRKPELTQEVVQDGWYATGDGGYLDENGFLFLTDRIKDMIVSGGENIYPIEVEEALLHHPAVLSAAVVGLPDDRWGESVVAVLELRPGLEVTAEDVRSVVRSRIAAYKCPKTILFDELPRTASGKVQRSKLRKQIIERKDAGA